jgi:hypothetical protein
MVIKMMVVEKVDPETLKSVKNPFVIACDGCARLCGVGGEKGGKELADLLGCDYKLISRCCAERTVKALMKDVPKDKTFVILACCAGFPYLEKLGYKTVAGAKTLGIGGIDENGKIEVFVKM